VTANIGEGTQSEPRSGSDRVVPQALNFKNKEVAKVREKHALRVMRTTRSLPLLGSVLSGPSD